ncbi:MAG: hypothetical protein LC116_10625 [Bacteroidetes bacterium]|nr:VWA domain-containing protein [Bacteroidota bacterium]MCZ2133605.1 hypothetical protein [Bacteroidota bacterium]
MANGDFSHITCIIDRSGSMQSIKSDAIGGFNSFLENQKKLPGRAELSLILFNHEYAKICDSIPLDKVEPLNDETYCPDGFTALLDAVGRAIDELGTSLNLLPENERPGKVILAILTDGEENSSRIFTRDQIFEKITHQQTVYSWKFIFLAANQDAIQTGGKLGIASSQSICFDASEEGIHQAYNKMSFMVASARLDSDDKTI